MQDRAEQIYRASIQPAPGVDALAPYVVPRHPAPIDLHLEGNEGAVPPGALLADLGVGHVRNYPSPAVFEKKAAARLGVLPEQVVVTAGADDALARALRSVCAPGRNVVLPVPTFEMLERYVRLCGADVRRVEWTDGDYPVDAVLAAVDRQTAAILVVSPNNPTGALASKSAVERLLGQVEHALIVIDQAYGEYADVDLTELALGHPHAVLTRTVSKAWGMAGLRVGYAVAAPHIARWLRAVGQPYAVSGPSLALAERALESAPEWLSEHVGRIRSERDALCDLLADLGGRPHVSQANFVLSAFDDAGWVADALAGFGIAVRRFTAPPEIRDCLRITCPGSVEQWRRLEHALRTALAPQALLFDMDGVLADVSRSFRACIVATARSFGVDVSADRVRAAKLEGDANDDWLLTWRLVREAGGSATVADVTARFEALYQGLDGAPGLRRHETLLAPAKLLERLGHRLPMAVVTGRPRADALRFLREHRVEDLFAVVVTRDDAPLKPSPEPLRVALRQLGVERAWMVGDTPDDVRAARAAGVLPVGILAPGETDDTGLLASGAGRVLETLNQLQEVLR